MITVHVTYDADSERSNAQRVTDAIADWLEICVADFTTVQLERHSPYKLEPLRLRNSVVDIAIRPDLVRNALLLVWGIVNKWLDLAGVSEEWAVSSDSAREILDRLAQLAQAAD